MQCGHRVSLTIVCHVISFITIASDEILDALSTTAADMEVAVLALRYLVIGKLRSVFRDDFFQVAFLGIS